MARAAGGASVPLAAQAVGKAPAGQAFPLASFGLQVYDDEMARKLTLVALEAGYRNFFASVLAGNQRGFARAVQESGVPRSELFICGSVVSNRAASGEAAYAATKRGCEQNLGAFSAGSIGYLDQIMLDYPGPNEDAVRGQWRAFEEMQAQGTVGSLAVSNFSPAQLDMVLLDPAATARPVVNQLPLSVAYHPSLGPTKKAHRERGVLLQAWAPLGGSLTGRFSQALQQQCAAVGNKHGKTWAQVALRWLVQQDIAFTTSASSRAHFTESLAVFDFELAPADMDKLSALAAA